MSVGLLHTAPVHVETFDRLIDRLGGPLPREHIVDPDLLADAMERGVADEVIAARLEAHLRSFSPDVERILCTCSTLAGAAESLSSVVGRPVVRIDRPMVRAAVAAGDEVAVVFAVESTLAPTSELLAEEARRARRSLTITLVDCTSAWPAFVAGDIDGYHHRIADQVESVATSVDAVVLSQASMADVADRLGHLSTPVLSSPGSAVEALLA